MASQTKKPIDLAARVANRRGARASPVTDGAWRRETFCLPRSEARAKAREWFERYPKAAYMTEIEFMARTLRRPDRVRHAPICHPPIEGGELRSSSAFGGFADPCSAAA